MDCILNHCHEQITKDVIIVSFYGMLVACMIVLALLARSKTIQTAAMMISSAWLVSVFYFFFSDGPGYYAFALILDSMLAYQFWRMARHEIFPAALCVIVLVEIAILAAAIILSLYAYSIFFILNRLFEITLIYVIGCSIFRMRQSRLHDHEGQPTNHWRLKFIAS